MPLNLKRVLLDFMREYLVFRKSAVSLGNSIVICILHYTPQEHIALLDHHQKLKELEVLKVTGEDKIVILYSDNFDVAFEIYNNVPISYKIFNLFGSTGWKKLNLEEKICSILGAQYF